MTFSHDRAQELMERIVRVMFPTSEGIKLDYEEPKFAECASLIEIALEEGEENAYYKGREEMYSELTPKIEQARQEEHDRIRIQHAEDLLAVDKKARLDERERCAKIVEEYATKWGAAFNPEFKGTVITQKIQEGSNVYR